MEFKDYYQTMGLAKEASADDIKRAYRKLARKYHPDVSKETGAEGKFKEINEAYDVLKDPEKRKAYDQMGANWRGGQQFDPNSFDFNQFKDYQGFQGGHGDFSGGSGDFGDFFEQLFGGRQHQRKPRARQGENLHVTIDLTLEEAYSGLSKTIQFTVEETTPEGRARVVPKTLKIKIPAGVLNDQQIRLAGQGAAGRAGGPAGDLYIKVHLTPHHLFHIQGSDIYLTVPITPWEAALGGSIEVPTLAGFVTLKIPAGACSGQKLRLKDKGFKTKHAVGAQLLTLQIQAPKPETEAQTQCYEQMKELFPDNPRAAWKGGH